MEGRGGREGERERERERERVAGVQQVMHTLTVDLHVVHLHHTAQFCSDSLYHVFGEGEKR